MSSVNVDALFQHLMEDPDIIAPEGQRKEDIALAMAEQRARQSRNNEKALNMVKMDTNVDLLVDFLSKAVRPALDNFDIDRFIKDAGVLYNWDTERPASVQGKAENFHAKWSKHSNLIRDVFGVDVEGVAGDIRELKATKDRDDRVSLADRLVSLLDFGNDPDTLRRDMMDTWDNHHGGPRLAPQYDHNYGKTPESEKAPEKTETSKPATTPVGSKNFVDSFDKAISTVNRHGRKVDEGQDLTGTEVAEYQAALRQVRNQIEDNKSVDKIRSMEGGEDLLMRAGEAVDGHDDNRNRRNNINNTINELRESGEGANDEEIREIEEQFKVNFDPDIMMITPEIGDALASNTDEGKKEASALARDADKEAADKAKAAQDRHIRRNLDIVAYNHRNGLPLNNVVSIENPDGGAEEHGGLYNEDLSRMSNEDADAFISEEWGAHGERAKIKHPEAYKEIVAQAADERARKQTQEENAKIAAEKKASDALVQENLGPGEERPDQIYSREDSDSLHASHFINPEEYDNIHEALENFHGGPFDGLSPTEKLDAVVKWHHDQGGEDSDYRDTSEVAEGNIPKVREGKIWGLVQEYYKENQKNGLQGPMNELSDTKSSAGFDVDNLAESYSDELVEAAGKITTGQLYGVTPEEQAEHQKMRDDIAELEQNYENSADSDKGNWIEGDDEYIAPDDDRYIKFGEVDKYNNKLHDILEQHIDRFNELLQGGFISQDKKTRGQVMESSANDLRKRIGKWKSNTPGKEGVDEMVSGLPARSAYVPPDTAKKLKAAVTGEEKTDEEKETDVNNVTDTATEQATENETNPETQIESARAIQELASLVGNQVGNVDIPDSNSEDASKQVLENDPNPAQENVDAHNEISGKNDGEEIVQETGKKVGMSQNARKALEGAGLDPDDSRFEHVKNIRHARELLDARDHLNENGIDPDGNEVSNINTLADAQEHTDKLDNLSPGDKLAHHIETRTNPQNPLGIKQYNFETGEWEDDTEKTTSTSTPQSEQGSAQADDADTDTKTESESEGGETGTTGGQPLGDGADDSGAVQGRLFGDDDTTEATDDQPESQGIDERPPEDQYRLPGMEDTPAPTTSAETEEDTPVQEPDSRQQRLPASRGASPEEGQAFLEGGRRRDREAATAQQEEDDAKIAEGAEQAFAQRALEGKRDYLKRNDFDPSGMSDAEVEAQFAKQRMATRVQHQAGLKHLRANGIDVNSDEFNKKFRPDGILDMHFDVNAAKNHVESEKKDGHLKAMAVVNGEFNEDRYNELKAKHSEDTSKDTDKALRAHRGAEAKAAIDNKRGMLHGEVQTMDALPDDVSKEDAMDRARKIVEMYGDHKSHLDENGGEGLLEPNHEGHLREMMNDAIAKGNLTDDDIAQISNEKDQHGKDFNKGSHRAELDATHDKIHADRSQHDEFLHSPDSHAERANAFKHSAGDEIHARMHLREGGSYEDFQDTKDEHSPFMHQKLPEGGKGRTTMSRDHGVSEDDVDHTDTSLRTRKPDHPPKIHGADKNLLAAQQEHHDALHGIHEDVQTLQRAKMRKGLTEDDTDEAVEKAQNALDGRKARMQELEEQHPQLADHKYKAASLGKKLHDSEYTHDDALGHVGLADMDPEALRQSKGLPPGPPPMGADGKPLVWAKGIQRWVKQENLMKYMSGASAGGGTYMPNGIDNDHPDVGSDEHAANASGPVMVTANGIHSVNPGGGSSTTGDVNDHNTNVANILGAMVAPHHADGDPKSNNIKIDKNTMDLAGANGPENQGQGETPQPGGGEAGAPPPTKPPEEQPEVFGAGGTGREREEDRRGTDKSAAHRFFSGKEEEGKGRKGGLGDYIKDALADAGGELPAVLGGGAVRGSDRWKKLRIRDFNRQEAKNQRASEKLARLVREVDDENT